MWITLHIIIFNFKKSEKLAIFFHLWESNPQDPMVLIIKEWERREEREGWERERGGIKRVEGERASERDRNYG